MIPFTESLRYDLPLTKDSIVVEVGTYTGGFLHTLVQQSGCRVFGFEPIPDFYDRALLLLLPYDGANVYQLAVGGSTREERWKVHGERTGAFSDGCTDQVVHIRDVAEVFDEFTLLSVDLLTINCEGMEYELLERMIEKDLIQRVRTLHVQWHSVSPQHQERRYALWEKLSHTHEQLWETPAFDNGWDGWRRKNA